MTANEQKMGFEGLIYYGAAGSTAGSLIPETRDMTINFDTEDGDTTSRQADGLPPIEAGQVTVRKWSMDFGMNVVPGNSIQAAIVAAAYAGNPIAFRSKDFATGKGYDGDVIVKFKHGQPLKGEQSLDFTVRPTKQGGRWPPSLYS